MATRTTNVSAWTGSTVPASGVPKDCHCDLCRDDLDEQALVVGQIPVRPAVSLPAFRVVGPVPAAPMPFAEDSLEIVFGRELCVY